MTDRLRIRPGTFPAPRAVGSGPAPARPSPTPTVRDADATRRRILPPYKVILHNDDHSPMDHVVQALQKSVPGMSLSRAAAVMWEAHVNGKAVVLACPLELAELYQQRLLSFGLTATIERDA